MKVLEIVNNNLTIHAECLAIPEFKKLWDSDKSKNKLDAINALRYVYFTADYKSLYNTFDPITREKMLKKDCFGNEDQVISEDILEAINKYIQLQETPLLKYLKSAMNALNKMEEYFSKIDFDKEDSKGNAKYKPREISACLKDAPTIAASIEKTIEKVEKEQSTNNASKFKGGGTGGALEFD